MSSFRRLAPLLLLTALTGTAGGAMAQHLGGLADRAVQDRGDRSGRDRGHDRREDHRALSDAVRRVERATGGEVLSAERVPFDGRDVNRVKVVDASGRVRVYMDDPQTRARRDDDRGRTRGDDGDSD
ncbi:hypothetical protein ACFQZQ_06405 [Lysobacter koreensis]|uniref:PepSY domain-containing protein n=1 Tax=Lysobacter koreensis TaxID=266122 RepID=A0ABW2YMM3_9GAMM